tara:strand:+ start:11332 stop:12456 length:1125 start_codon:yes stop_codon:yes gene_type:complete
MKPNVIFVLLDGCRWDRTGISSDFKELVSKGTFFDNITAAIPYTVGAVNAIFSGLYGKDNGIDAYYKVLDLKDSIKVLPEIMQENGYFTSCDLLHDKVVSKRGYNIHQAHKLGDDQLLIHKELLEKSFEMAGERPVFSYIHFTLIHDIVVTEVLPKYEWDDKRFYEQKEKNLEVYDKLFLKAVDYAKKIEEFITKISGSKETIIIFFSDHGTAIGERFGERNYGSYTFEETIRTFYLFMGSNILSNQRISSLKSTIDIFPTILDLCKISYENNLPGISFASELENGVTEKNENREVFSETGAVHGLYPSPEEPNVFCIKTNKYKLIYFKTPNEWSLYDLEDDPLEEKDLFGTGLYLEKELQTKLLDWINRESKY